MQTTVIEPGLGSITIHDTETGEVETSNVVSFEEGMKVMDKIIKRTAKLEDSCPLKVGDVLHYQFSYNMTLNNFYQVMRVKSKAQVIVRRLRHSSTMCGQVKPFPNEFKDSEELVCKIRNSKRGVTYKVTDTIYSNTRLVTVVNPEDSHYENYLD